ncbi:hypothetical protein [Streptomyces sp. NPDC090022]|uniref:hypothetical protein n=1 Tax=Streptomyces sp. NPDC090022 TaxID=3365920 RepID=UPI0037F6956C
MSALPSTGRPVFEPTERVPALAALRSAVTDRRWDAVAAAFEALPDEDDRVQACRTVAETPGAETFLRQVADQRPGDPLPRTLLAQRLVQAGWDVRTAARAEHVSRRQFDAFFAHLRQAEQLLIDVCAEYPAYGLAWYVRIITGRGLELGQSETRRRHDRLAEHHPHHYSGQLQLLQQLCPKWGGTWEAADAFVRDAVAKAPEGNPNGALVAVLQMEHYLELTEKESKQAAERHLRDPGRHARLVDAARRSVLHPAFRPDSHQAVGAHSAFAAAHSVAGRPADAAPHFRALGDHASEFPWGYVGNGDHEAAFVRHRKTALAKG